VAVYGATGYTGRLVAAELARRGADFVLAGRSAEKLERLATEIGGADTAVAALDDGPALQRLLEPCAALISCAGPFERCGEPILEAALQSSTHYLDSTGEQPFMAKVFARDERARQAGIALVTAMGFDYVPGDMIAGLTAAGLGPLDELLLAYSARGFGPSRGTAKSAIGMLSGGDVEWRDGRLQPASQRVDRGFYEFPPPLRRQRMARYPAGEHLTVPRHVETRNVRTVVTAATVAPHPRLAPLARLAGPLQLALRTPARRLIEAGAERLPEGPPVERRRAARFTIACEARGPGGHRRGLISGSDVYGMTAASLVEGALLCATPGYEQSGALAPSQAFDPPSFLASLSDYAVSYEVGHP
jgi:short subunit dehydrogenase-like uncharacterized protein